MTLFHIEDWILCVSSAKLREILVFPAADKFHAQNIPVKLDRGFYVRNPKSDRRNLSNPHGHTPRVYLSYA
jgi:hypothetical protein